MENSKLPTTAISSSRRTSDIGTNLTRLKRGPSLRRSFARYAGVKLDDLFKSPSLDFIGKNRKRRRTDDEDNVSLNSVDLNIQERKKKRRSSFANLLSPIRPVKHKVNSAFQRSFSLRNLVAGAAPKVPGPPYRQSGASATRDTPPKRRLSTFWHETVDDQEVQRLDKAQLDRQEAIYEVYKGEEDIVEDLMMIKKTYYDSMKKLGLLSAKELDQIFGHIHSLIPLHQELVEELRQQRLPDGTTDCVGQAILAWVPQLESYVSYCANQVYAKALLDIKRQEPAIDDFLQRCQESPFSRRLDLWSFLDVPRSRLVKYPLLFKSIQKLTSEEHEDHFLLEKAIQDVERLGRQANETMGAAKCDFTRSKLDFLDSQQKSAILDSCKAIVCDGILKNNRGTKLHVFLFDKILVLTRPATRGSSLRYQVYRQPIPVEQLHLEDLVEGQGRMGSFKSAFSQSNINRNAFKVSFVDGAQGQAHTLTANDQHDKRQWIQSIRGLLPPSHNAPSTLVGQADLSSSSASSHDSVTSHSSGEG